MAITRLKFESYYEIKKYKSKGLTDQEIIKLSLAEYDVNLTEKDIKEMKENYANLVFKYIN